METKSMNNVLESGRQRYHRNVALYFYDKEYIESDGEPFIMVRISVTRTKGERYNIADATHGLMHQLHTKNFRRCSALPVGAVRIVPNIYLHVSPYVRKLFNFTGILKRKSDDIYIIHNMMYCCSNVPTRTEMLSNMIEVFNSPCRPVLAERHDIIHCLNDGWANVGVVIEPTQTLWLHLKQFHETTFELPTGASRDLAAILDNGEMGDTYLRTEGL